MDPAAPLVEDVQQDDLHLNGDPADTKSPTRITRIEEKIHKQYKRVPLLRRLPPRAAAIIILLVFVNMLVWAAVGVVLSYHSPLSGTAILAYTFGLRHALDADHISAIDLMTRRLVAAGQRPVTVGTWFSLGHSTIVIITSIIVAATASAISDQFSAFSRIGGIIGSSVSAAFLLILGAANGYILLILLRQMKRILRQRVDAAPPPPTGTEDPEKAQENPLEWKIEGGGPLFRLFRKLFRLIDRPWKMYPIGVLFGLGFDTSSEVALLGIAALQAAHGTSIWLIMVFPLLFTAGMCLLDTVDGALMLALYTTAATGGSEGKGGGGAARDALAVLYYNLGLTCLTVVVAVFIGVLQLLQLVVAVAGQHQLTHSGSSVARSFWAGAVAAGNHYDVIGGAICALFLVVGVATVMLYPRWRRWIDRRYPPCTPLTDDTVAESGVLPLDDGDAKHKIGISEIELPEHRSTSQTGSSTRDRAPGHDDEITIVRR